MGNWLRPCSEFEETTRETTLICTLPLHSVPVIDTPIPTRILTMPNEFSSLITAPRLASSSATCRMDLFHPRTGSGRVRRLPHHSERAFWFDTQLNDNQYRSPNTRRLRNSKPTQTALPRTKLFQFAGPRLPPACSDHTRQHLGKRSCPAVQHP